MAMGLAPFTAPTARTAFGEGVARAKIAGRHGLPYQYALRSAAHAPLEGGFALVDRNRRHCPEIPRKVVPPMRKGGKAVGVPKGSHPHCEERQST
jgi:hypothetical protein